MYNNNAIGTHGNVLNSLLTAGSIPIYQSITVPTLHCHSECHLRQKGLLLL